MASSLPLSAGKQVLALLPGRPWMEDGAFTHSETEEPACASCPEVGLGRRGAGYKRDRATNTHQYSPGIKKKNLSVQLEEIQEPVDKNHAKAIGW